MGQQGGYVIDTARGNFPCRACSVADGVASPPDATWRTCQQCKEHEFQIEEDVTYVRNGVQTAQVGGSCTHCSPGRQRTGGGQCRRPWGSPDICCSSCPVNKYKSGFEGACQPMRVSEVAVIFYSKSLWNPEAYTQYVTLGATAAVSCTGGDMLMFKWDSDILHYCEDQDDCNVKKTQNSWRICMRCGVDQTKHIHAGACVPCANAQQKFLVDSQGQCQGCQACQELQTTPKTVDIFDLSTTTMRYPSGTDYKVNKIEAKCVDLRRRQLQKTGVGDTLEVIGSDVWRHPVKPRGDPLPDWHFVDRNDQCKKKACDKKCDGYTYSNGCGERADTVLVRQGTDKPVRLAYMNSRSPLPTDLSTWSVVTEGECEYCTFCVRGSYNAGCNKGYGGTPGPEGQCSPCNTQCEADHFLHHPLLRLLPRDFHLLLFRCFPQFILRAKLCTLFLVP
jgi:hypothetical protein